MDGRPTPTPPRRRRRWLRWALAVAAAFLVALGAGLWWALSESSTLYHVAGRAAPDAPRHRMRLEFREDGQETRVAEFEVAEGQSVYFGSYRCRAQLLEMVRSVPFVERSGAFPTISRWLLPPQAKSFLAGKVAIMPRRDMSGESAKIVKRTAFVVLGPSESQSTTCAIDLDLASGIRSISCEPKELEFRTESGTLTCRIEADACRIEANSSEIRPTLDEPGPR